ncbi:MAG: alkaline phosphatase D family protein, partial [Planctomycetota bacterium]|nr:alkaline phosphatase D family protein [Planctomycetota bacterium]
AMEKALAAGLPAERFVAGPRELFKTIAKTPAYRKLMAAHAERLVHGPVLGHLTDSQVKVWLRTSRPGPVRVAMTPRNSTDPTKVIRAEGRTYASTDFTCAIWVRKLEPMTEYDYTVSVGQGQPIEGGSFKTLHRPTDLGKLTIAFGGGAGYVPQHERMWTTIESFDPDLLLLLGDNIYIDAPTLPGMQRYCYYRRQSRSEFRRLVANTPVYAIWDDHDFGTNDCHGGPLPDEPPWKKDVYRVFSQNWPNPYFGIQDAAGCFFDFSAGNVYFILLDGRCFRENPKNSESPSMLGQLQLAWLKGRLSGRNELFKIICSPVPWSFETKNNSLDTWNGFREERDEIFAFLTRIRMEGVLLLSADRHRTDIWKLERPKINNTQPYPLIELNSSRLTNQHVHPEMKAAEFSYNKKQSFGFLDIDSGAEDPKIVFKAINIDGEIVHTKTILYSSLCFQ